ncbi:MAG: MBL fold metallo-hydrolase [Desulfovibrionaceae bacterium]|nr:MBL fold metallo-hydrolase [Desulfovibrionaceae bacterium]MBF0514512.1 MBL fold metallo-hydrolase [Desulfovibrionaceae bacterium]
MNVKFLGAARTVTGSCFMLEAAGARFAVDCGMHQGNAEIERRNLGASVYDPPNVKFFLITHAHIDHSGLLPRMVKKGFRGKIYTTSATRDLLEIMLLDSAHIQEMEAEWQSRREQRHGGKRSDPLYTVRDAQAVMPLIETVPYGAVIEPTPGVTASFQDAGHILGAAFIELWVKENGGVRTKYVFSGDLGRPDQLLMKDPATISQADYLFMESTYGDRDHKDQSQSREELAEAIAYSQASGEKIIIPAFAVERTQEVLYILHQMSKAGQLPAGMPIYLDSPLAIRATQIFRKHPEFMDPETNAMIAKGEDPLGVPNLRFTESTEDSRRINESQGSAIVISASGMCNAGRIKHHLRHNLWRKGASIVFVGYQGEGTPGRKIVDGAKKIKLFGEDVAIEARIFTIGGFSAHAGQSQILAWMTHFKNPNLKVFLVHGENAAQQTLAALIRERFGFAVYVPEYLETCVLKAGVEPAVTVDRELAAPSIDWSYLLTDAEAKLALLKDRLAKVKTKPWTAQTDLRDRLLEIDKELMELVSEI